MDYNKRNSEQANIIFSLSDLANNKQICVQKHVPPHCRAGAARKVDVTQMVQQNVKLFLQT